MAVKATEIGVKKEHLERAAPGYQLWSATARRGDPEEVERERRAGSLLTYEAALALGSS